MRWDNLYVSRSKGVESRASNISRIAFVEFTESIEWSRLHETHSHWLLFDVDDIFRVRWDPTDTVFLVEFDNGSDCFCSDWLVSTKVLRRYKNMIAVTHLNRSTRLTLMWPKPDRAKEKMNPKNEVTNETVPIYLPSFGFLAAPCFWGNRHQTNLLSYTTFIEESLEARE